MKNGTQVKPVHISKTVDRSVDVSVNPYKEALTQEVDGHLHEEPSLEMNKCDLAWSILSTTTKDNGPYVEMNTSNLYNKLQEDKQLISGNSSDQWEKISGIDKKMQELEEQNGKIFHPPPIEGIDIGCADGLEILDPKIRIRTEEDFVLPPPLESLLDKAKMAYKFLPKQGDIDRLIAKINKKVLRDTNLCVDLRDLKAAYLTSPHFRDIICICYRTECPWEKEQLRSLIKMQGII